MNYKGMLLTLQDLEKVEQPSLVSSYPEAPKLTVETVHNHIYFYATVDSDRCLALMKTIRELDAVLRSEQINRNLTDNYPPVPIWLHVLSPGGGLFCGMSIADQLKSIATPVYSIVEGYCASAATLISMACSKRFIHASAFMLIHQLSGFMWGKYEEFKDEMRLLDMAMKTLTGFYVAHSKLSEDDIAALLKRDSWFDASECLEKGFVDEVLP